MRAHSSGLAAIWRGCLGGLLVPVVAARVSRRALAALGGLVKFSGMGGDDGGAAPKKTDVKRWAGVAAADAVVRLPSGVPEVLHLSCLGWFRGGRFSS